MTRVNVKVVKPKKKVNKKALKKKMDIEWAKIIKARAGNRCAVCEHLKIDKKYYGRSLNAHHMFGKGNTALRWDFRNGISLCVGHHRFGKLNAHKHYEWFERIIKEIRPNDYIYCKEREHITMPSIPLEWYLKVYKYLKEEVKKV